MNHHVVAALRRIIETTRPERRDDKVYHEGQDSYTWIEIIREVRAGSEMGNRYVATVVAAAAEEGLAIAMYLSIRPA